jgi:hypothetical protein
VKPSTDRRWLHRGEPAQLETAGARFAKYLLANRAKLTLDATRIARIGAAATCCGSNRTRPTSPRPSRAAARRAAPRGSTPRPAVRLPRHGRGRGRGATATTAPAAIPTPTATRQPLVVSTRRSIITSGGTRSPGACRPRPKSLATAAGLRPGRPTRRTATPGVFLQDDWTLTGGWQSWRAFAPTGTPRSVHDRVAARRADGVAGAENLDIRCRWRTGSAPRRCSTRTCTSAPSAARRASSTARIRISARSAHQAYMAASSGSRKRAAGRRSSRSTPSTRADRSVPRHREDDGATDEVEFLKTNLGGARVYGLEVNLGWGIGDGSSSRADGRAARALRRARARFRQPRFLPHAAPVRVGDAHLVEPRVGSCSSASG